MEFSEPRAKFCKLKPNLPLPLIETDSKSFKKFRGIFNGFSIVVQDPDDMKSLISMGYFGKANFSRSFPCFEEQKFIRKRQFEHRKQLNDKFNLNKIKKIIVVPDSDEEEYFSNLQPTYQIDKSGIKEKVFLNPVEAFFLSQIGCLTIVDDNKELEAEEAWSLFRETDCDFVKKYVVYYYFRSKGWVVKPGIKFGGDFMLYKQGPAFYHASYLVLIQLDGEKRYDNVELIAVHRLCETAAKDLLIVEVSYSKSLKEANYLDLKDFKIKEIVMKRWTFS